MYSKEELLQAITVALLVPLYLLNTHRVLKAIELCKECLFLLNHKKLENEKEFVSNCKLSVHGQLFSGYSLINDHRNVVESGRKLLLISQESGQRALEGIVTFSLAQLHKLQCDYNEATELYRKALSIAIETGERKMEGDCYGNLGSIFQSIGEYVKAREYQEKALAIAEKIGNRETKAICYGSLGRIFQSLGEYVKAKEYNEKALVIAEKIGDSKTEAACYGNLGSIFLSLGEYVKAKEYQAKALTIAEKIGDSETKGKCYLNLGRIFQSLGEYVKAKEYQEKALAIAEKIGDRKTKAKCYLNLGSIFLSRGEYVKAKEYQEKALPLAEKSGDRETEAACYGNLGSIFQSFSEYVKAKEYQEKAFAIAEKIGNRETKAKCYVNLGGIFQSLGEYVKAEEYQEKALAIAEKNGDKQTEAKCYGNLGRVFMSLGEYTKAKEYQEKALAIAEKIGNRETEATCHVNLGDIFQSHGEYVKAKEYQEKALAIAEKNGDRETEATCYEHLGTVFLSLGECVKAKDCLERALVWCRDTGEIERESRLHFLISLCMIEANSIPEAKSHFSACVSKGEVIGRFLKDHDQFKILYFDKFGEYYRMISHLCCFTGSPYEGLYTEEIGRARALADLMSSQYSIENKIHESVSPQAWVGVERFMTKEHNCACLYISYLKKFINLWVVKADNQLFVRAIDVNDCFVGNGPVSRVADVFCTEIYREAHFLDPQQCEDRSWFPSNIHPRVTCKSSQENSLTVSRPVEEDEDDQQPILTLADGYKMIIAPVADLLDKTEIIVVPDRLFFKIPFAALKDEKGKYFSESFRIRIVPSLTTLKLIQDSPADYHSQTGALIVGDPDVGDVLYKGNLQRISRLPFASEEAEMVGDLLGTQPLLGEKATKETVLQSIHSVSLIHFAAHGDAERGEIVLAPPPLNHRKPQEEDYLLTMADISKVRLRAKLVVLSCCHSAKGQIKTEGVVGIARAFLGSGARSVLVALWAIEDEATKQFMSRFYEHLVRGESASESLHQAMKWMRENGFSKVEQWAPFMLVGDNVTLDFQKLRDSSQP